MKKSVKILIIVLCIIIVGLVTFIVVDKVMNNNRDSNKNENVADVVNSTNEIEKSNKNEANTNETNTIANDSKTEIANEAIRKVLKDKDWLNKKVKFTDDKSEQKITFAKISSINGNPAYFVYCIGNGGDATKLILITYDGSNVVTSNVEQDYGSFIVDLNKNIVCEISDMGEVYYEIKNNKFVELASTGSGEFIADDNTNVTYPPSYINNEVVSPEDFEDFKNKYNFLSIETKLTDENIDKYVK